MPIEPTSDFVSDMSLLYELALAAATSSDPDSLSRSFLRTLLRRKNLAYGAVWLRDTLDADEADMRVFFARPRTRLKATALPRSHPMFEPLRAGEPLFRDDRHPAFAELIAEEGIEQGAFAIFPLKGFGVVKLYAAERSSTLNERVVRQLRAVLNAFAVALEGGLAHRRLTEEIQERRLAEERLQAEIEERIRVEEDLRASEANLKLAQQVAHMGNWDRDLQTNRLRWSDEMYRIFGLEPGRPVSLDILASMIHPDDKKRYAQAFENTLHSGQALLLDYRIVRPDGEVRRLHEHGRVIRDASGHPIRHFGTTQDFTERQAVEEERKAMRRHIDEAKERETIERTNRLASVGLLAAGLAHEINNPLQGMLSHLGAVRGALPEDIPQHRSLEMIEQGIDSISALVRKLLLLSSDRPDTNETADYADSVRFVVGLLSHQFRRSDIRIERTETELQARLALPQKEFVQILLNLFLNARDAMNEGGKLTVTACVKNDRCHMRVADTGGGIPQRIIGQIFSPFFTTKGARGSGLGLSVAESIIRTYGGAIEVETTSSKGTTFYLQLPLAASGLKQNETKHE